MSDDAVRYVCATTAAVLCAWSFFWAIVAVAS